MSVTTGAIHLTSCTSVWLFDANVALCCVIVLFFPPFLAFAICALHIYGREERRREEEEDEKDGGRK